MKKKLFILSSVALMGLLMVAGIGLQNNGQLTDIALANIEALAVSEDLPGITITCNPGGQGLCWTEELDTNNKPTGKCLYSGRQYDTCTVWVF